LVINWVVWLFVRLLIIHPSSAKLTQIVSDCNCFPKYMYTVCRLPMILRIDDNSSGLKTF
jgi:hypothetical protein